MFNSSIFSPIIIAGDTRTNVVPTDGKNALKRINGTSATYLFQPDKLHGEYDTGDKTIQCGRKTDCLKLWLMWKHLGDEGLAVSAITVVLCIDSCDFHF
jgi:hypothetical protein